jgi:predicted nucleic-acid-binding protein
MIGLDSNVLVRYLVQDDPDQARTAAELLENQCSVDEPGFVNAITLVELVWVLERSYHYTRAQIAPVLEDLLTSADLTFEHAASAWDALQSYRSGNIGFADLLIGRINRFHGCRTTKTFDRKASRSKDFEAM